ncbi:MAG: cysteine hydrolase family protein [Gammaproteobacteria bacterium]
MSVAGSAAPQSPHATRSDDTHAALLVMDVQVATVQAHADPGYTTRLRRAIDAARAARLPIIFVKAEFRPGYPEVSARSRVYTAIAAAGGLAPGDPGLPFHPGTAPGPNDIVVTKRRTSAFSGSDLEVLLRSLRIDTLVLAGLRTSGVVEATLREAVDRDYSVVVLADGCGDADPELQRVLLEKICARYGDVLSIDDWIGRLPQPTAR